MRAKTVNENMDFQRGRPVKAALNIGKQVTVFGDLAKGKFDAVILGPYEGSNYIDDNGEIWKIKIIKAYQETKYNMIGKDVFAIKYAKFFDEVWGEIDADISGE